jgi:hypothetical protein
MGMLEVGETCAGRSVLANYRTLGRCRNSRSRGWPVRTRSLGWRWRRQARWHALAKSTSRVALPCAIAGFSRGGTSHSKHEAYLLALLSVQNFRLPNRNVLVSADELTDPADTLEVVRRLKAEGHGIYVPSALLPQVRGMACCMCSAYLSPRSRGRRACGRQLRAAGLAAQPLELTEDRRQAKKALSDAQVDLVISLARGRPTTTTDPHYLLRRMAVDFGLPLINDVKGALFFTEALPYRRGLKDAVRSWQEWVPTPVA